MLGSRIAPVLRITFGFLGGVALGVALLASALIA